MFHNLLKNIGKFTMKENKIKLVKKKKEILCCEQLEQDEKELFKKKSNITVPLTVDCNVLTIIMIEDI